MRQLKAIVSRETGAFFKSAMAPVVLTGFLVATGALFFNLMSGYSEMSLSLLQNPQGNNFMNLSEGLFGPMSRTVLFFLLFMLPAITMRVFAPEFGSGRYDLIASWPVQDHVWVLGKWLSAWLVTVVMILAAAACGPRWPESWAAQAFRVGFDGYAWFVDLFLAGIVGLRRTVPGVRAAWEDAGTPRAPGGAA